jgi:prepilin-type N-terminal cleavage/methylation domain-containing protein
VNILLTVKTNTKRQKGMALLEVIVSLALLGIISVVFLQGAMNSTNARVQVDERTSAKILAESLIDNIKKATYATSYDSYLVVPSEFTGYSVNLTVTSIGNGNIQKLSIAITHLGRVVLTLQSLKVKRDDEI